MLQDTMNDYITPSVLAMNMHCLRQFSHAIDVIYQCGQNHNYSAAATHCVNATEMVNFPIGAADEDVEDFHTAILQPIYLDRNTSKVVGFIGGGFNWIHLLTGLTREDTVGVVITVRNNGVVLTFEADHGVVSFTGFEDLHKHHRKHHLADSLIVFPGPDGTETSSTYAISLYPRTAFFDSYRTDTPLIAAIASALLIALCAATSFYL